jgi:tetratricopeptide (TPR) repeat protein
VARGVRIEVRAPFVVSGAALLALALGACASTKEEQAVEAMREALAAARVRDLDTAQRKAEEAAELRPGFIDPLMMLAGLAQLRGEWETARGWYRRVLQHDPTDTAAGVALGHTYVSEARFEDARAWFAKAIEADPGFEAAAYNLGSVHQQLGDLDLAAAWFDVASALDRRDPRALVRLGSIRLQQGRARDALAAADAALARHPASQPARELRAAAVQALPDAP